MKVVLLGGTKGMGRALGRLLVGKSHDLFLLGRDEADLARSARDLEVRGNRPAHSVKTAACDLAHPETFAPALEAADRALGAFDTVIVTAGLFAPQDELEADEAFAGRMLQANFTGTVLLCEEARKRLLAGGRHPGRVQLGGRRARAQARRALRRLEGRAIALSGSPRSSLS